MKNYAYYVVSLLALAFAALGSCQKEDGASLLEEQKRYKFTLTEAKEFFYLEATDLQLPSQTIGKVKSGLPDLNDYHNRLEECGCQRLCQLPLLRGAVA